jgi:hypothetical protein
VKVKPSQPENRPKQALIGRTKREFRNDFPPRNPTHIIRLPAENNRQNHQVKRELIITLSVN